MQQRKFSDQDSGSTPDTGRQITLFPLGAGDAFDVITLLDGRVHDIQTSRGQRVVRDLGKLREYCEHVLARQSSSIGLLNAVLQPA